MPDRSSHEPSQVNATDHPHRALFQAFDANDTATFMALLRQEPDMYAIRVFNSIDLLSASLYKYPTHAPIFKALLKMGFDPNRIGANGDQRATTPWLVAAGTQRLVALRDMAKRFGTDAINRPNNQGETPLAAGLFPFVRELSLNVKTLPPVVAWLLDHGADVNVAHKGIPLYHRLLDRHFRVTNSIFRTNKKEIKQFRVNHYTLFPPFLKAGLDVHALHPKTGEMLLHRFLRTGLWSLIPSMLDHGADLNRPDAHGTTFWQALDNVPIKDRLRHHDQFRAELEQRFLLRTTAPAEPPSPERSVAPRMRL